MRVRSLYNAGLLIEGDGFRLLCDPWFTNGAYQGAWAIWPPPLRDPVRELGKVDAIYISHVHPDHYDRTFLRAYLQHWGRTPILVGLADLADVLERDGFSTAACVTEYPLGKQSRLLIVPNLRRTPPFDTALAVRDGSETLVNLNDNPMSEVQVGTLLGWTNGAPTVAYLPFGAGSSYPQRCWFPTETERDKAAEAKKRYTLARFLHYVDRLNAEVVVPFAGEYWLQGPLAEYNAHRGQADATEAMALCDRALVPESGQWLDLTKGYAEWVRVTPYDPEMARQALAQEAPTPYDYEREFGWWEDAHLDVPALAHAAWERAQKAWTHEPASVDYCVAWDEGWLVTRFGRDGDSAWMGDVSALVPRMELNMDSRYLVGLLLGRYHWNDADISSHVFTRREPNVFDPTWYRTLEAWHL